MDAVRYYFTTTVGKLGAGGSFVLGASILTSITGASTIWKYNHMLKDHPYLCRGLEASVFDPKITGLIGDVQTIRSVEATRDSDGRFGRAIVELIGSRGSGMLYLSGMRDMVKTEVEEEAAAAAQDEAWYAEIYRFVTKTPYALKDKVLSYLPIESKAKDVLEAGKALDAAERQPGFIPVVEVSEEDATAVQSMQSSLPVAADGPLDQLYSLLGLNIPLPLQKVDLKAAPALANPAAATNQRPEKAGTPPIDFDTWKLDCSMFVPAGQDPKKGGIVVPIHGEPKGSPFAARFWSSDRLVYKNEAFQGIVRYLLVGGALLLGGSAGVRRYMSMKARVLPMRTATTFTQRSPDILAALEAAPGLPPVPKLAAIANKTVPPINAGTLPRATRLAPTDIVIKDIQVPVSEVVAGIKSVVVKLENVKHKSLSTLYLWISPETKTVLKANLKWGDRTFDIPTVAKSDRAATDAIAAFEASQSAFKAAMIAKK